MKSIMEYLIDQTSGAINEAFKQQDFDRACDLLEKVLRKQGYSVFPGMEEMLFDGKKASCLIACNDNTKTLVTINFFNSGDAMSPDSITVIDTDVNKMLMDIVSGNERSSVKGMTYDCTGVGITAILKVVAGILGSGAAKADSVIAQHAEYFTLVEGVEDDIFPLNEAFQAVAFNQQEIDAALAEMEAAGKSKKELSGWCYKMGRLAQDANEMEVYEYLRQRRFAFDGKEIKRGAGKTTVASTQEEPNASTTNNVVRNIPVAKEMTVKQLKASQAQATADFWAKKLVRRSAEERMDMMAEQVKTFIGDDSFNLAIFAGAPGVGKTFTVERELKAAGTGGPSGLHNLWGLVKGSVSLAVFYRMLFLFRNQHNILLIDDGDAFLDDKEACDIFKAATDSKEFRIVSYNKSQNGKNWQMDEEEYWDYEEYCNKLDRNPRLKMKCERSKVLRQPGIKNQQAVSGLYTIPSQFVFQGRIIILTNRGFNEFEPAILDRAEIKANLDFTDKELFDLVKARAPFIKTKKGKPFAPEVTEYVLKSFEASINELEVYNQGKEEWQQARISTSLRKFQNACTMVATYWGKPSLMEEAVSSILASNDSKGFK